MTNNLQKAVKLLAALSFLLCGLLVNGSNAADLTSKNPGSGNVNKFEKVTVKGSGMDSLKLAGIPKAMLQFNAGRPIVLTSSIFDHE
jgi:hypothetical protein